MDASDCDIVTRPREMTSNIGECEYLQHSSPSTLPKDVDRKETASGPRQPDLDRDDVTETRIVDYAGVSVVILPEAVNSSTPDTARVHEHRPVTRGAHVLDRSNSQRPVTALEDRTTDQARSRSRRGISISALLIPENSTDPPNNGAIETRLPDKEINDQMESVGSDNTQNSGREVGGYAAASWGKLVSARQQLRLLLAGSGKRRARSSRSRLPPSP